MDELWTTTSDSAPERAKSWISGYRGLVTAGYITSCPERQRTTNGQVSACSDHQAPGACIRCEGSIAGKGFSGRFCMPGFRAHAAAHTVRGSGVDEKRQFRPSSLNLVDKALPTAWGPPVLLVLPEGALNE